MIGIYKIENLVNHKVYIGQSVQLSTRWRNHNTYVCRGERHQAYNYIWKYVSEDFPEGQNLNIGGEEE